MQSVSHTPQPQPAHLSYPQPEISASGNVVSPVISTPSSFTQQPAAGRDADANADATNAIRGWREKIATAWDLAKRKIKAARNKLHHAIEDRFKPALRKLFGRDLTPGDVQKLDRQLERIEKRLESSPEDNVHYGDTWNAGGWAQRGVPGGYIYLAAPSFDSRDALTHTIIHEASHSEVNTDDHWYVNPDLSRFNNFYTGTTFDPEIDFEKAMDNADTITYAVDTLSKDVKTVSPAEERCATTRSDWPASSSANSRVPGARRPSMRWNRFSTKAR